MQTKNFAYSEVKNIYNWGSVNDYRNYFFIAITRIEGGEVTYTNYSDTTGECDQILVENKIQPFYSKKGSIINFIPGYYRDDLFGNKCGQKYNF